jgi:cell division septation protein DedD
MWVQVGAFREVERAMQVVTDLRDQAVSILSAPGQPLVRVVVGPFADRGAAAAKLRELRRRGYEAFIADAK